jgi:hypothetical protein
MTESEAWDESQAYKQHVYLLEERERSECSIGSPVDLHPRASDRAAAHVPLPRITMSKSAARGEISFCQRRNTARKAGPAGGVGGGYRGAVLPRQPLRSPKIANFPAACG